MDDPLFLARLQFALTAGSHFLFVALTLGLATLVAIIQTRATISRSPVHERMVRFWGQLYVINYAMGIVTGLLMEFQFGLAWGGLSRLVGDVFGAPIAMETLVAFFVESTFLGLWIFGWGRFGRWVHLAMIWVVTLTAYASAFFILVGNGFLKRPVGYEMRDGVARLTDAGALLTNPAAVLAFWHVLFGALVTAGVFMAGVSAYHLRRRTGEVEFFRRSLRIGMLALILSIIPTVVFGGAQFPYRDISVPGVADPPKSASAEAGLTVMMSMWGLLSLLAVVCVVKFPFGRWLTRGRLFHVVLMAAIPLPYLAMLGGWVSREMGRQPWAVVGVLRTEDALGPVSGPEMAASLTVFVTLFTVLTAINIWLLGRYGRRGPDAAVLGAPPPAPEPARDLAPTF
jgi:cytochrome d ubiquinol oxidase subunit I